jgi:hypothetical protein
MTEPRAQRTLVKSPPELWAEVSDVAALAQHLGEFGEIRIVRLEPETTVAWEGDTARGTVELQASGWGTKVTLTAELLGGEPVAAAPPPEPEPVAEPVAVAVAEPVAATPREQPGSLTNVGIVPTNVSNPPTPEPEPAPEPPNVHPAPTIGGQMNVRPQKAGFLARLLGRKTQPRPAPVALNAKPVRPAEPPAVKEPPKPEPVAVAPEPVAIAPEPVAIAPEPAAVVPEPPAVAAAPAPLDDLPPDEPTATPGELRPGEPVADRTPDHDHAVAVLTTVLDDLGSARHRPFSR